MGPRVDAGVQIEIWSDVACPWCYIGKRRLTAALARFEGADEVIVRWRSFELNPDSASDEGLATDMLAARKGLPADQVRQLTGHVTQVAAGEGITMDFQVARAGSTFLAHQLLHLADEHGLQDELKERFFRAQFTEGLALGERDVLVDLAVEVGLDRDEVVAALAGGRFADAVRADEREAAELGANGVPFFVVDRRYGFSGAQPTDAILDVLDRAWRERVA